MPQKRALEVGDKIYRIGGLGFVSDEISGIYTIVRVTSTQAISQSGTKFKRDNSEFIKVINESTYSTNHYDHYELETEELKAARKIQLQRRCVRREVDMYLDKLTSESLQEIMHIFAGYAAEGALKEK